MKIDFSQVFKDLEGEVVNDAKTGKPLTLAHACAEVLLANDTKADGLDKLKRYDLASKIYKGEKDSLTVEEIVLIKELAGQMFTPLIVGQLYPMLDIT